MYEKYKHLLKTDSTERQNETYQTCKARYGGIVLSLDGIQPAKGNEPLYVLREGLQAIEVSFKQNEQLEEKEKEIINGYCEAIRSILLEDGKPSLELPGMKIYERLEELKKSFEHSLRMVEQKKRLSVYLKTFPTMINRRNHKRSYHKVQEMYEIIRDIVKSLEKTSFSISQSHEEALKSLLIKAFQEKGQKHGMKGFMENLK